MSVSDVQSFHGLTNFYRCFIRDFSSIASPLNEIIKKDMGFRWEEPLKKAFPTLKERLSNASMLALPYFHKSLELECDASNVGVKAMMRRDVHYMCEICLVYKMAKSKASFNSTRQHPTHPLSWYMVATLYHLWTKYLCLYYPNPEGMSKTQSMVRLHEIAKTFMERQGKRYDKRVNRDKEEKVFAKGDLVWVHIQKERFPTLRIGWTFPNA
ncbi:Retrovirus-related Pol polyprotein from transposon 17.6, partial [Mucuna pruriens]